MEQLPPDGWDGVIGRTVAESVPDWPARPRPGAGAPHVVVIVLDDTGFSHLGCYGSTIDTPVMDRLAAEGLRYTGFHTTALCSPTRASLLTGRGHHAVGMRGLSNWSSGFPNCTGRVTPAAATLAEVLGSAGYSTLAVGKWHLAPMEETSAAGPFWDWPLGRGFGRYYGFLQGMTSQFHPELYCDNHAVDPPTSPAEGYHLSQDLVDQAIAMLSDQRSLAPERPFFLYLAFGATHAPHHAPQSYLDKYRGRFDAGWDEVRAQWFATQQELGIVPPGTGLAPRNPGVLAWAELGDRERILALRLQEAFAGFLEHTDAQIGRLVAALESLGVLDDTLLVLLSDNGASQEGGPIGVLDTMRPHNGVPEDLDEAIARLAEIGGPSASNNYPWGWAQAGNTPLKRYKQNTHGGGVRDPLIIRWPGHVGEPGGIRPQFCHVSDLAPTILEAAGVPAPAEYRGVPQLPVTGTSLGYTFAAGAAALPTRKRTQLFEMLGHRGIWHDGWKAVAYHRHGTSFETDEWELYHLDEDFSECHDLAASHPGKLAEMIQRWWAEAGREGALPLDDRGGELFGAAARRRLAELGRRFVYYPPVSHVNSDAAPPLGARSFDIVVDAIRPAGTEDGVLVAYGGATSGFCLYVQDGRLAFDYNLFSGHHHVVSSVPAGAGRCAFGLSFRRHDRTATASLRVNGAPGGSVEIPGVLRMISALGMDVGRDAGDPVCADYAAPFPFAGIIERVVFEVHERTPAAAAQAAAAEASAAMAQQ